MRQILDAMMESKVRCGSDHRAHLVEMLARDDIPANVRINMKFALGRLDYAERVHAADAQQMPVCK